MTRSLPEWRGKTDDHAAPQRVQARVIFRQDGICACGCGVKMGVSGEGIDIDHKVPLILGGENRESNLQALRRPCHKVKTRKDVAQKATEARKRNKHLGLTRKKSSFATSRDGAWKAKVGGGVVRRGSE